MKTDRRSWVRIPPSERHHRGGRRREVARQAMHEVAALLAEIGTPVVKLPLLAHHVRERMLAGCARPTTQRALRARGRCGREGGGWPGQRRTPRGGSGQQSARGTQSRGRRNIGEEGSGESVQGRRLQTELGSGTRRSASATWPIGSIAPGRSPSDARRAERPRR